MIELPSREDVLYVVTKTSLFLGVLALGAALGLAIGLAQLQAVCVEAGVLPTPGLPLPPGALDGNPCWAAAKWLQGAADGVGVGGAVLLIGGGVLDQYSERVVEIIT